LTEQACNAGSHISHSELPGNHIKDKIHWAGDLVTLPRPQLSRACTYISNKYKCTMDQELADTAAYMCHWWLFTWTTILPNFTPFQFETTEPWSPKKKRTTWVAIWDQFLIQK